MQTQIILDKTGIHYKNGGHEVGSGHMTLDLLGINKFYAYQSSRKYFFLFWALFTLVLIGFLQYWAALIAPPLLLFAPSKHLYIQYVMDKKTNDEWIAFLSNLHNLCTGTQLWIEGKATENINTKYHAGAYQSVNREHLDIAYIDQKGITGLGLNATFSVPTFRLYTWSLIILFVPNGIIIQRDNVLITYSYDELQLESSTTHFIEDNPVAPDAEVIDYTWRYINRDGSPDGRFKNNKRLPVCINGKFTVHAPELDFTFQTSGKEVAARIVESLASRAEYIARFVKNP
ncbi:MAG: hypothetical protein J6Y10_08750 [Lachnospiraceae bacterium]|nr:hypothetical protein [Lachnospiraceae bacterium]